MCTERWWNDTEKKFEFLEINLSYYHFVHPKHRIDSPGIEHGPSRREAVDSSARAVACLDIKRSKQVVQYHLALSGQILLSRLLD